MSQSRQRSPKASERQKMELVNYFEKNSDALRTVSNTNSDSKAKQKIWIELTHRLNNLDGTLKTCSKWSKYWNDIIVYTKNRARIAIKGNFNNERPPTDIEKRILTLVGQLSLLKVWMKGCDQKKEKENAEKVEPTFLKETVTVDNYGMEQVIVNEADSDYEIEEYDIEVEDNQRCEKSKTSEMLMQTKKAKLPQNFQTLEMKVERYEEDDLSGHIGDTDEEIIQSNETGETDTEQTLSNAFFDELKESIRIAAEGLSTVAQSFSNIATLLEKHLSS